MSWLGTVFASREAKRVVNGLLIQAREGKSDESSAHPPAAFTLPPPPVILTTVTKINRN